MIKHGKKLALRTETVRKLGNAEMSGVQGAMPPLTFTVCVTANCMTLGETCSPSNNCLTLGQYCWTSGCRLTFTSC
jgi:hypothetical protein